MQLVNLMELTKMLDDSKLNKLYYSYLLNNDGEDYRDTECEALAKMIFTLNLDYACFDGFIVNYKIPHLNKEFDLLKISNNCIINIEIKSEEIALEKIEKQHKLNRYYLNIIGKELISISYVESNGAFYIYDGNCIKTCSIDNIRRILIDNREYVFFDLDKFFVASNFLVSPLNNTDAFLKKKYVLTENQKRIKNDILKSYEDEQYCFSCISGSAGTGKTLLLYDIAIELSKIDKVLIIHCGSLNEGHEILRKELPEIEIVSAKSFELIVDVLGFEEQFRYILVDESQRMFKRQLIELCDVVKKYKSKCIFSFDEKQCMSNSEIDSNNCNYIRNICNNYIYNLTNTIRTNKELIPFISKLFDLNIPQCKKKYDNLKIIYERNENDAVYIANKLVKEGFKYISYTPSLYRDNLYNQKSGIIAHSVIGQEFEKVCMIIDNNFFYEDNKLCSVKHSNPDYLYDKMLYQGLTRAREKIALIITNKEILGVILRSIVG